MMLVIGSTALSHAYGSFNRKPADLDIICYEDTFSYILTVLNDHTQGCIQEVRFANELSNKAYARIVRDNVTYHIEANIVDRSGVGTADSDLEIFIKGDYVAANPSVVKIAGLNCFIRDAKVAKPSVLLMMKLSHRYRKSVHFKKTMDDINFLRKKNIRINEEEQEMLKRREAQTYVKKTPSLNQSKRDFFTDNINYVYDHDDIHLAVKHLDKPAYMYYIGEGKEVMCSKDKFFAQPESVKLFGVLEEAYVLALERAIVPHGTDPKRAFDLALEKICTVTTGGWFREFAYDNYYTVQSMYHDSFVRKFNDARVKGLIRNFQKG